MIFLRNFVAIFLIFTGILAVILWNARRPLFSVILSTYNNASFVPHAVESVVSQNFDSWELIIVNDGSTDDTQSFLDTLTHEKIKIISRAQNKGLSASRNEALRHARGKYVWFLDADDKIAPGAMKSLQNKIDQTGADMISFKVRVTDETGQEVPTRALVINPAFFAAPVFEVSKIPTRAIISLPVCSGQTVYRADIIRGIDFPEGVNFEDNIFHRQAFFRSSLFAAVDETLYLKLNHPDSITAHMAKHFPSLVQLPPILWERLSHDNVAPEIKKEIFKAYMEYVLIIFARFSPENQAQNTSALRTLGQWIGAQPDLFFKEEIIPFLKQKFSL